MLFVYLSDVQLHTLASIYHGLTSPLLLRSAASFLSDVQYTTDLVIIWIRVQVEIREAFNIRLVPRASVWTDSTECGHFFEIRLYFCLACPPFARDVSICTTVRMLTGTLLVKACAMSNTV